MQIGGASDARGRRRCGGHGPLTQGTSGRRRPPSEATGQPPGWARTPADSGLGVVAGATGPAGIRHSSCLVDASAVDLAGALAAPTGVNTRAQRGLVQRQGLFRGQQHEFRGPRADKHPPTARRERAPRQKASYRRRPPASWARAASVWRTPATTCRTHSTRKQAHVACAWQVARRGSNFRSRAANVQTTRCPSIQTIPNCCK